MSKIPKIIKIKAGKELNIEVPYESFPIPHARWAKDGEPINPQIHLRHVEMNDKNKAVLSVAKAQRSDTGKYQVKLKNTKGEVVVPIEIEVIDKPGVPEGPLKVSDVFADKATVSWKKPADDGGSPIMNYIVERRDVNKDNWQSCETVSGKQLSSTFKLTPGKQYMFRVRAVNLEGEGPDLESEESTHAKNPYDEPKPPGTPEIVDWDNTKVDLAWEKPTSDGGAPIEKYMIEKRETPNGSWSPVSVICLK